jgi:hypothetical protein
MMEPRDETEQELSVMMKQEKDATKTQVQRFEICEYRSDGLLIYCGHEICFLTSLSLVSRTADHGKSDSDASPRVHPPPRLQIGQEEVRDEDNHGMTPRSTGGSSAHSTTSSEQRNGPYIYARHSTPDAISPLSCGGDWVPQQLPHAQSPPKPLLTIQKVGSNSTHNRSVPSALLGVVFDDQEEEIVFEHDPKSPNGDSFSDEPLFFHDIPLEDANVADHQAPGVFNFDSPMLQQHLSIDHSGSANAEDILKMISANQFHKTQKEEMVDQYEEGSSTTSWKSRLRNNFLRRAPYKTMRDKCHDTEVPGVDTNDDYNEGQQTKVASYATEMEQPVHHTIRRRAVTHTLCWLLVVAVALGLGATGIYFLVKGDGMTSPATADTTTPWIPSNTMRQEQFRAVLGSLSGYNELNDYSTPEYQALYWISNVDGYGLDPETSKYETIMERYVAALLYFSTSGDSWNNQFNFLSQGSICEWNDVVVIGPGAKPVERGILCNDQGRVKKIDLTHNNITGRLPWEIASLESLHAIHAPHNQVEGSLPSQLGLLSLLKHLDLNNNLIASSIPNNFGFMSSLKHLKLRKNRIEGSIPSTLGKITQLTFLDLSSNQLTGILQSNLGSLTSLDVAHNALEGTIPAELSARDYVLFDVSFNNFHGSLDAKGFCGMAEPNVWADCLGENADVQCSCCTCCSDEAGCQE